MEIEQRLGLYQVFLKLYEHHRNLLDEILQLEKISGKSLSSLTARCVTGAIQGEQVYLVTNLVDGKTQTLLQSQGIWTIGRDRQLAISIPDRRLSRRHAVIQFIKNEGFYLVDLNSTNGSFVNGEPVHGRFLLKDGDRVRLSSLAFSFFLCQDTQTLEDVPLDILAQLESTNVTPKLAAVKPLTAQTSSLDLKTPAADRKQEVSQFLPESAEFEEPVSVESSVAQLSPAQQSEILDRFFSRKTHKVSESN